MSRVNTVAKSNQCFTHPSPSRLLLKGLAFISPSQDQVYHLWVFSMAIGRVGMMKCCGGMGTRANKSLVQLWIEAALSRNTISAYINNYIHNISWRKQSENPPRNLYKFNLKPFRSWDGACPRTKSWLNRGDACWKAIWWQRFTARRRRQFFLLKSTYWPTNV